MSPEYVGNFLQNLYISQVIRNLSIMWKVSKSLYLKPTKKGQYLFFLIVVHFYSRKNNNMLINLCKVANKFHADL